MKTGLIGLALAAAVGAGVLIGSMDMSASAVRVTRSIDADSVVQQICITPGDRVEIRYTMQDAATGKLRGSRLIRAPLAGGAVMDQDGVQLAVSTPAGLMTDATSVVTRVNSLLSAAAGAGKIDP